MTKQNKSRKIFSYFYFFALTVFFDIISHMKKFLIIILAIIFSPITILVGIVLYLHKRASFRHIYKYLSTISINDIDGISGYEFEEIVAYLFSFFDFKTTLTNKTGDYGVDVFATYKKIRYCIQAKLYYNHNVGPSAVQQANTAKNYYSCDFAVVITNSKYTKQAIDMADKLKVILLDRQDLVNILDNIKSDNKKFLGKLLEEKLCLSRF